MYLLFINNIYKYPYLLGMSHTYIPIFFQVLGMGMGMGMV